MVDPLCIGGSKDFEEHFGDRMAMRQLRERYIGMQHETSHAIKMIAVSYAVMARYSDSDPQIFDNILSVYIIIIIIV